MKKPHRICALSPCFRPIELDTLDVMIKVCKLRFYKLRFC